MTHSPLPAGARPGTSVLTAIALATCLALIVFCIPLTTGPATVAALQGGVALQAWLPSAMPLGAAVGLLGAGAMGDARGRRAVFLVGLWLTAAASGLVLLAQSGVWAVAGRLLQGLGCAGILACGLGLLAETFHGEARARAARIWAASLGAGVAIGPLMAAGLQAMAGWRASYGATLILAVGLAVLAQRALPVTRAPRGRIDHRGALLLMFGLGPLLAALIQIRSGVSLPVLGLVAAGLLFLGLFIRHENRVSNPILIPSLFRNRAFTAATTGALASGAGVLAIMGSVPVILQRGLHLDPVGASLVLLAWSALTAITALTAASLTRGRSPRVVLILSLAGCAMGQALLLAIGPENGWPAALPGLIMAGLANGVLNAALGAQAVDSVPAARAAMGSGANNTARYLGSAVGFALIALLMAHGQDRGDLFLGWHEAVLASLVFTLLGLAVIARPGPLPAP